MSGHVEEIPSAHFESAIILSLSQNVERKFTAHVVRHDDLSNGDKCMKLNLSLVPFISSTNKAETMNFFLHYI